MPLNQVLDDATKEACLANTEGLFFIYDANTGNHTSYLIGAHH